MDKSVEHGSRLGILAGFGTTLASWGVSDWMAVFGFMVALVGLGTNIWAVRRRDAREQVESSARLETYREAQHPTPESRETETGKGHG